MDTNCQQCGKCCRSGRQKPPGVSFFSVYIPLAVGEELKIANFLAMSVDTLRIRFDTDITKIDNSKGYCPFQNKDNLCIIHKVKPRYCAISRCPNEKNKEEH